MRLGINGWRLRTRTGVARVLLNIVRHWSREFVSGRFDTVTLYSPIPLDRDLPIPDFVKQQVVGPDWRMLIWENLRLPRAAKDDVLLCPSYSRPLFTSSRTVSLIYEATQKLFPQYYPFSARLIQTPLYGWSARHSTLVVTNTEQGKEDIVHAYRAPPDRVRVVPLAPAEIFRPVRDETRLSGVRQTYVGGGEPFFLYVGKLTARRNVPRLVEALAEVKRLQPLPHKLVIVGLNTTNIDLHGLSQRLGLAEDVKHHAYVSDEDLAVLYSAAEAFVLPYSYESAAALTLLEAQAAGAPVITADTIGLREAAGEAALFTPDVEVPRLADAMLRIASDPSLRRELSTRGASNAAAHSWQRCSNEMLDILREAAQVRSRCNHVHVSKGQHV
jgi:glycosyltransferase involved in cell wall biosynthesis